MMGKWTMQVDIQNCTRCGGNHENVVFSRFTQRPHKDNGAMIEWTHWAMCPKVEEPILARIEAPL